MSPVVGIYLLVGAAFALSGLSEVSFGMGIGWLARVMVESAA